MADFTTRDKVTLLKDFLNVVGTETEGVEVKITRDADQGMRWYVDPEVLIDVKNDSGAQIDKGTPVYVSGTHGGSGKPTIEKAQADDAATMPAIGLTLTDLADEAEGYVVAAGTLRNLDTDTPGWDAGDALYVSPTTAGGLQTTRPTGDTQLVQKVALVTRRHATAGSVIVMGAGRTNDTPNDSYSGRYDTEAETARSDASTTTEIYYTARPDGDGYAESEVDDTGETDAIQRRLYYSDKFDADPDTSGDWTAYTTQPADNTAFATAKASLLAGLSDTDGTANTRGTLPVSLKMERTLVPSLLLNAYSGAVVGVSVRKINSTYAGACMRIREDSGNTETDIGFDSSGDLDTAAIKTFCDNVGAGVQGFVVKWYDQSGNSNDLEQSTTSRQPRIYTGTSVSTYNSKPALEFVNRALATASNITLSDGGFMCSVVFQTSTGNTQLIVDSDNSSIARVAQIFRADSANTVRSIGFTSGGANYQAIGPTHTGTQHLGVADHSGTALTAYLDGTGGTAASGVNTTSAAPLYVGARSGTLNYMNGVVQEVVHWPTGQSSDRSGIESDINTYFSIY